MAGSSGKGAAVQAVEGVNRILRVVPWHGHYITPTPQPIDKYMNVKKWVIRTHWAMWTSFENTMLNVHTQVENGRMLCDSTHMSDPLKPPKSSSGRQKG